MQSGSSRANQTQRRPIVTTQRALATLLCSLLALASTGCSDVRMSAHATRTQPF